jgi:hypothetical protein
MVGLPQGQGPFWATLRLRWAEPGLGVQFERVSYDWVKVGLEMSRDFTERFQKKDTTLLTASFYKTFQPLHDRKFSVINLALPKQMSWQIWIEEQRNRCEAVQLSTTDSMDPQFDFLLAEQFLREKASSVICLRRIRQRARTLFRNLTFKNTIMF